MSPKSSLKEQSLPTSPVSKIVVATDKLKYPKSKIPDIPKRKTTKFDTLRKKTKENKILPESMISPMKKSKKVQEIDIL